MVIYIQGIFRQTVSVLGQEDIGTKDMIKYSYVLVQQNQTRVKCHHNELKLTYMHLIFQYFLGEGHQISTKRMGWKRSPMVIYIQQCSN